MGMTYSILIGKLNFVIKNRVKRIKTIDKMP